MNPQVCSLSCANMFFTALVCKNGKAVDALSAVTLKMIRAKKAEGQARNLD